MLGEPCGVLTGRAGEQADSFGFFEAGLFANHSGGLPRTDECLAMKRPHNHRFRIPVGDYIIPSVWIYVLSSRCEFGKSVIPLTHI